MKLQKVKQGINIYVLVKDITNNMVTSFSTKDLLGHFDFIKMTRLDILDWISMKSQPLIIYVLRVTMLVNGWVVFHFLSQVSLQKILNMYWIIDKGSLV